MSSPFPPCGRGERLPGAGNIPVAGTTLTHLSSAGTPADRGIDNARRASHMAVRREEPYALLLNLPVAPGARCRRGLGFACNGELCPASADSFGRDPADP